ncbi:hypothetical protein GFS31_33120 [Leptolyngbya sp. BL0902]|nr:hypothetical protein GFS31_33120 [Leptolyngbya sp. BL0902]
MLLALAQLRGVMRIRDEIPRVNHGLAVAKQGGFPSLQNALALHYADFQNSWVSSTAPVLALLR